jgi:hypothetical protein
MADDIKNRLRSLVKPQDCPFQSALKILDTQYAANDFIVKDFLLPGSYLFAGEPKVGKSFMMTQLCLCVSEGIPFLGFPTTRSTVLYMALEDWEPRFQERLIRMYGTERGGRLQVSFEARHRGEEVFGDLENYLILFPDVRLIVIDTFQLVRGKSTANYSYSNDYDDLVPFGKFAHSHNIAIVLVHHTRKNHPDENPFKMVLGTNGLTGACDGAFVLSKKYISSPDAELEFISRSLGERKYKLHKDSKSLQWMLTGVVTEPDLAQPDPLIAKIDEAMGPGWQGTATELSQIIKGPDGEPLLAPNALTRRLNALTVSLLNDRGIVYRLKRTPECKQIILTRVPNDDMSDVSDI